jgi:hypothetical protein
LLNASILEEFIASGVEVDEEDVGRRAADHARLDRQRELDDQDLVKIAQDLNKRYGQAAVRYTGDMNEVPQRLLMPSVHDASLWQVRVKVRVSNSVPAGIVLMTAFLAARARTRYCFQFDAKGNRSGIHR